MRYIFWLVLIILVIFRYYSTRPKYVDNQKLRITTRISSEPLRYPSTQSILIAGLRVYLPAYPEVSYGDKVIIEGIVEKGKLKDPILIEISKNQNILFRLRDKIISFYRQSLPEPHSSLVAGVTLGSKASIPAHFWESLKRSGTVHVVVASGMNVTLVAGFLIKALIPLLKRKYAIPIAIIGIWIYVVLSGFDAPLVRAAIMGSIAFSAQVFGRLATALRDLFLAALFMLLLFPDWAGDLGFILSFVATLSLIMFEEKIYSLIRIRYLPSFIRRDLSTSLAAQIGVAPILFATFGQFSLWSPFVNAILLWTIPLITIIGGIAGIVALAVPFFGRLILLIIFPLTWWFVSIVELL